MSTKATSFTDPPFIKTLRKDLERQLTHLDAERARLLAALVALSGPRSPRPRRRELRDLALEAVEADPGIRASMLAFSLGRDADEVVRVLEILENDGLVHSVGRGWVTCRPS